MAAVKARVMFFLERESGFMGDCTFGFYTDYAYLAKTI
jgi:hypothetical protein